MIRCFVTSTIESGNSPGGGRRSARQILTDSLLLAEQTTTEVKLVDNSRKADVVVYAESHNDELEQNDAVHRVIRMPEYQEHRQKAVVHSGKDIPRPLVPGLYPSIPEWLAKVLACQGSPYLVDPNPFLGMGESWHGRVDKLASFLGHCTGKPIRERLVCKALRGNWSDISIKDTSDAFIKTLRNGDDDGHNALKRLFVIDMLSAKFALCLKGIGLSSFRIFEAMQLGRAPIIIADGWSAPPGPDWGSFSIRIRERDLDHLPDILREREPEWKQRGELARRAWKKFYSPDRLGITIVQQAHQLLNSSNSHRALRSALANAYVQGPRRAAMMKRKLSQKLGRVLSRVRATKDLSS